MSKKEDALRILKLMREEWDVNSKCPNAQALDMAIESLDYVLADRDSYDRGYSQGRIDLEANVLAELKRCADDYRFDFDESNFKLVARIFEQKR